MVTGVQQFQMIFISMLTIALKTVSQEMILMSLVKLIKTTPGAKGFVLE